MAGAILRSHQQIEEANAQQSNNKFMTDYEFFSAVLRENGSEELQKMNSIILPLLPAMAEIIVIGMGIF